MKLTPEDLQRIEDKKVANILRKIYTEKRTPTAREDAILARAGVVPEYGTAAEPLTAYVSTWDELARALGVTRRAIQDWRTDPRYQPEIEKRRDLLARADGRHCVAEWLRLMADLHLKRGAAAADQEVIPGGEDDGDAGDIIRPPRVGGRQSEWTVAIAALDHRKKENAIRVQEGTLLIAADLEIPLGAFLAALQSKLHQFPFTAARRVRGLADESECRDALRDEIDAIAADLQLGRYLADDAAAAAVADEPFDPATDALCKKLLFDGADRTALLDLAGAIALRAVRKIGAAAIGIAQRDEPDLPIAATAGDTPEVTPVTPKVTASPKRKRKPRAQPTPPPAAIEATIVATRAKATRRKRH